MSILSDTRRYEAWLRKQCKLVEADLAYKHQRMRKNAFVFLRATYYRWARKIEEWCPELTSAPSVLAIGDLHTENYGTWRDGEGRLVWGINDFDEAAVMPYTLDLVRLTASAVLAPGRRLDPNEICRAIQSGYREGLTTPGPILLEEKEEVWMRPFVNCTDADCIRFWGEVKGYPDAKPPRKVMAGLTRSLPIEAETVRFCTRVKGGGSLGRSRYVAVARWSGGHALREAKALVASAWDWAHERAPDRSVFLELARGRFRSADPFLDVDGGFIYRRIAADSRKVELGPKAGARLNRDLLRAMGRDLGAVHAAHAKRAKEITRDLKKRRAGWLTQATEKAAAAIKKDYAEWRAQKKSE
jgi:hypothetical protein